MITTVKTTHIANDRAGSVNIQKPYKVHCLFIYIKLQSMYFRVNVKPF